MSWVKCLSVCGGVVFMALGCGPKDEPSALVGRPPTQDEVANFKPRVRRIKIESYDRHPSTVQAYDEAVTKVFEQNLSMIQECARDVAVNNRSGIYITVKLTLSPDGFAKNSLLTTQNNRRDAQAISCLEGHVLTWEYPIHPKQLVSTQKRVVHLVKR